MTPIIINKNAFSINKRSDTPSKKNYSKNTYGSSKASNKGIFNVNENVNVNKFVSSKTTLPAAVNKSRKAKNSDKNIYATSITKDGILSSSINNLSLKARKDNSLKK